MFCFILSYLASAVGLAAIVGAYAAGLVLEEAHGERIIDPAIFSAVVIMVVLTTLITPPALKWSLARGSASTPAP